MLRKLSFSTLIGVLLLLCSGTVFSQEADLKPHTPQGRPELIDLIKNITPMVVSISIERHHVEPASAEARPLVHTPPGLYDERKLRDKVQNDSLGSGFICDNYGHIITNAHVVDGAGKILVTLSSGKVEAARVIAVHPKVDLALIKIDPPHDVTKAKLGDSTDIQVGEWVLAVGNPFGLGRTVTVGIVSGKGRFLGLGPDDNFIQTDAAINPGNSGGPLFNMSGEVIGVNTAIISSGKGIGFSIPSNYVAELLKTPGCEGSRGWLGMYVDDMGAEQAAKLGLSTPRGVVVDEAPESCPAYNAGLRRGDLILDANGKPIQNGGHLSKIVASTRPGDILKMTVVRGGIAQHLDVEIGQSPE